MEALLGFLPFLLILLICPLMMFFMHGGQGHGGHEHDAATPQPGSRIGTDAGTETARDHTQVGS